jgi:TrmH family RNA methyltransferase
MFTKNRKKLIKSLHQKKYRDAHGLFIVEGEKMTRELISLNSNGLGATITDLYCISSLQESFPEAEIISSEDMTSITAFKTSPGILAVAEQPSLPELDLDRINSILILDDIKDPGNLGTIIRSAEWFGIEAIILSPQTVELYNPKTVQSTMGSLFRATIYRGELEKMYLALTQNKFTIYAADMNGDDIKLEKWAEKKALIIGSEAHGISAASKMNAHKTMSIQGVGNAESLNAGVAASIIISHW